MRWFKHMASSHLDEALLRIRDEFGLEGYGLYWLLLERIAEQLDDDDNKTFVELSPKNWRSFTQISPKKFRNFLNFSSKLGLFSVEIGEKLIRVDCPKLLKYRDEYTRKKAKVSGQAPDNVAPDTETELEEERERRAREADGHPADGLPPADERQAGNPPKPKKLDCPSRGDPEWPAFLSCWQVYPVQQDQENAWREWVRLARNGTLAPSYAIREHIQLMVQQDSAWADGFAPLMVKYLTGKRWEDQPRRKAAPGKSPPVSLGEQKAAMVNKLRRQVREAKEENGYAATGTGLPPH
jgi:hypothetical protein